MKNRKYNIINMSKDNLKAINVIYHDENIKFEKTDICKDCFMLRKELKCTIILTNDLNNLDLLIKYILKTNTNSKFALIVNGSSAEETIAFIKKNNNYKSLFINSCIYTSSKDKYSKVKENNSDFVESICIDLKQVINFINNTFQNYKEKNEKFPINTLINFNNYNNEYFPLHKQISSFYGNESEKEFSTNFTNFLQFIKKENISDEIKTEIINSFQSFSFLNVKNYEDKIITFLKYDNFARYLNTLLNKKDLSIYKNIGYFVGSLMNSLVQYGNEKGKGVNQGTIFYYGEQLSVIDVLEFLKNKSLFITFPYFLRMTTNKKFVELITKNKINKKEKEKDIYSVIIQIDYLYDDGYEPCVFDLRELAQYPDEEEYILFPFTFLYLKNIVIDSKKLTADIHLEIIGKSEILEFQIKNGKSIHYDKQKNIMIAK